MSFASPAPFSLAGAGMEAGGRYHGTARTPGTGLGGGFSPGYVPSASVGGARGATDHSGAGVDGDAPPLQSFFDLPSAAAPPNASAAAPPAAGAPPPFSPSAAAFGCGAASGASAPSAAGDGEHWVTVFGYSSVALVPQVLDLLRPSGGQVRPNLTSTCTMSADYVSHIQMKPPHVLPAEKQSGHSGVTFIRQHAVCKASFQLKLTRACAFDDRSRVGGKWCVARLRARFARTLSSRLSVA